jgi:hypothetical protein
MPVGIESIQQNDNKVLQRISKRRIGNLLGTVSWSLKSFLAKMFLKIKEFGSALVHIPLRQNT